MDQEFVPKYLNIKFNIKQIINNLDIKKIRKNLAIQ